MQIVLRRRKGNSSSKNNNNMIMNSPCCIKTMKAVLLLAVLAALEVIQVTVQVAIARIVELAITECVERDVIFFCENLEILEKWDHEDVDEQGLLRGVKAILMSPRTVTPYWVKKTSVDKFVNLKMKLTTHSIYLLHSIKHLSDNNAIKQERANFC